MQDGVDSSTPLARHPATAAAGPQLYNFFISEALAPDERDPVARANVYCSSDFTSGRCAAVSVVAAVPRSEQLLRAIRGRSSSWCARSRSRLDGAFRVNHALTPLLNMGQQLFEPPDVNGWELGPGWFSTAACWRG